MNELTPFIPNESAKGYPELLKRLEALHVASYSLSAGLHPCVLEEVAKGIALVNNYYSNLIESEGTHPADISRAMNRDFSSELENQKKQRLALAYREAQEYVLKVDEDIDFAQSENLKMIHEAFYGAADLLPEQLCITDTKGVQHQIVPGEFRILDVEVGLHLAPAPSDIPRLLNDFYLNYRMLSSDLVLIKMMKAFAAHHRYMYIHPFLDGNGRTGRLLTDAMLKQALPESYGLWSLSRGLARNNDKYKQCLARADQKRQGNLDGRGLRSESGLVEFIWFMTETALDQVEYMKNMLKLDRLHDRLQKYVDYSEESIPNEYKAILPVMLISGEVKKAELPGLWGCSERKARDIAKQLKLLGLIDDANKFAPYRLCFNSKMLSFVFPDLIPVKN